MTETVRIPVWTRGRIVAHALVDATDAMWVSEKRWILVVGYAVQSNGAGSMHRQIMGLVKGDGRVVHHINEDKLDNRHANLAVFGSAAEANSQPHPLRDHAAREGVRAYDARQQALTHASLGIAT